MLGEAAEKAPEPSTKPKAAASIPVERMPPTGGRQAQAQALKAAGRPIPGRGRGRGRGRPRRRRTKSTQVYVSGVSSLLVVVVGLWAFLLEFNSVPCLPSLVVHPLLLMLSSTQASPRCPVTTRCPTSLNQTRPIIPKRHKQLPNRRTGAVGGSGVVVLLAVGVLEF